MLSAFCMVMLIKELSPFESEVGDFGLRENYGLISTVKFQGPG